MHVRVCSDHPALFGTDPKPIADALVICQRDEFGLSIIFLSLENVWGNSSRPDVNSLALEYRNRNYFASSLGCDTRLWTMVKEHLLRSDVIFEAWTIGLAKGHVMYPG